MRRSLCKHTGKTKIKNATRAISMSDGTELQSLRWSMRYPTFNSGSSGSNKSREWHAQLLAYLTWIIEHCLSFGKPALGADQNQISPDQNKDSYSIICFVSICFGSNAGQCASVCSSWHVLIMSGNSNKWKRSQLVSMVSDKIMQPGKQPNYIVQEERLKVRRDQ